VQPDEEREMTTPSTTPPIVRAFAPLGDGQIHYAECGPAEAPPVLLLHQTPRSWREFAGVLPIVGERYRAIAMDTLGFGDSVRVAGPVSIERWAGVAVELLDALGIERAHVVGHHTGGVIAIELAASYPGRVDRLVLSSTPYTDAEFRRARAERPPIDEVEPQPDGSHLTALWGRRQGFYPLDRPDLLLSFVRDALVVIDDVEGGHTAVGTYRMEDVIDRVVAPTLVIRATDDPFAFPHGAELREHLAGATVEMVDIDGGMVPLPDQLPHEFAAAVLAFLDRDLPR
jgi:pimeloyl-ACP methyl ester carboxylesterase